MRRILRKAAALVGVHYADMLQYRAELYLWAISGVMRFILMGLWFQASTENRMPLSPVEFARYFLAVFVVRQLTMVWVVWVFERDVVQGRLSPLLLQPLTPVWRYLAAHVAERLARFPFILALIVVFFGMYPESIWVPGFRGGGIAVLAIAAAFAMRFIMQYTFAMLAFWTERANAIEDLWFALYLFLSGYIAPLEVFPAGVRNVTLLTPFPYMVYLPATLLTGRSFPHVGRGFLVMGVWALAFVVMQTVLWHRGLRHYSAMGA